MAQMTQRSALALLAVACVAVILLYGCDGSGDVTPPSGTLQVMMIDAPASQLSELHVRMTRVTLTNRSLATVTVLEDRDIPDDIDLLALANDPLSLGSAELLAGSYTHLTVEFSDEPGAHWLVTSDGQRRDVQLADGNRQLQVLLLPDFNLQAGSVATLLLDFSGAASVHQRSDGTWVLQPVVSGTVLPANPQFGTLRGTVSELGGAPLQVPPGLRAAVFLEMPAGPREVQSIAELESDGSFSFPRVPVRQYALVVRFAEADWSPVGDPLLQEFGAVDVARRPVQVNANSSTVVNTTVVR